MEDALIRAEQINKSNVGAILNILGEHYEDRKSVEVTIAEYYMLLDKIKECGLDACISVKPSQCGLMIDEKYCMENIQKLLAKVKEHKGFLWIDMENSEYTDVTIKIYEQCLKSYSFVGLAVQTNLKRTEQDTKRLLKKGGRIRLCKGAYREDVSISYPKRSDTTANYQKIMKVLFEEGDNFAIATHDMMMIEAALSLSKSHNKNFEFQMLQGVRESTVRELAKDGYRVLEYVPYGPRWLAYFLRRLRERPRNVITMFRSLMGG